jgi:hypothetical protein
MQLNLNQIVNPPQEIKSLQLCAIQEWKQEKRMHVPCRYIFFPFHVAKLGPNPTTTPRQYVDRYSGAGYHH